MFHKISELVWVMEDATNEAMFGSEDNRGGNADSTPELEESVPTETGETDGLSATMKTDKEVTIPRASAAIRGKMTWRRLGRKPG